MTIHICNPNKHFSQLIVGNTKRDTKRYIYPDRANKHKKLRMLPYTFPYFPPYNFPDLFSDKIFTLVFLSKPFNNFFKHKINYYYYYY